jgi:hypothetical protein
MFSDNDLGKHINTLYRNRKLKVQEAIKRKEQVFQMKQFNDKCINSKNKIKGFWNFIKGNNYVNSPSQVFNPENHSEMLVDTGDINNALKSHVSSIGQDRVDTENNIFRCEVEDFVSKIDQNLITSDTPISLNIHRENIKSVLESLRLGKTCGIDEIPNEFLKYGGNTRINSLLDLFTKITDLEKIPEDWHKGIIKLVHKGGSMYDLDNYRCITLTSNVYKVYAKIIEQSVMSYMYMEDNDILGEAQVAFRRDSRTGDNFYSTRDMCT